MERTLVLVKPDGVKRQLIGEVIQRLEKTGLKVVAVKMATQSEEFFEKFYPSHNEWYVSVGKKTRDAYNNDDKTLKNINGASDEIGIGKAVKKRLVQYMKSGPVVAIVLEGNRSIEIVRKICGATYPINAAPGTIRGDLSIESVDLADESRRAVMNVVHASGNIEDAKNEIGLWFKASEIMEYETADESVLYPKKF